MNSEKQIRFLKTTEGKAQVAIISKLASFPGGVKTYVDMLLSEQNSSYNRVVFNSMQNLKRHSLDLLHFQEPDFLSSFDYSIPALVSLHNHDAYCASGTKFFRADGIECSRKLSVLGCTFGHLVNHCGSRRPWKFVSSLRMAFSNRNELSTKPVTILANSNFVRNQMIDNGVPAEKIHTLLCGILVDEDVFANAKVRTDRLAFAGRIVATKGLDVLLYALQRTRKSVCLDVIGEGWDLQRCQLLSEKLGIADRITWHGLLRHDAIHQIMNRSRAVIFPSRWPEPAGLITLEAYRAHTCVIASNLGGIPEYVVHGQTGILFDPNKIDELVRAINQISESPALADEMGKKGNELLRRKFRLETHLAALQEFYDRALQD